MPSLETLLLQVTTGPKPGTLFLTSLLQDLGEVVLQLTLHVEIKGAPKVILRAPKGV